MVEPMRYYDDYYPPYVPVAERRAKAEKKLQQLRKKQPNIKLWFDRIRGGLAPHNMAPNT
jgi:hypothetical protein